MAVPKRKVGSATTHARRANWKISGPTLSVCPQCKSQKLTHRVCKTCGYYNGKKVIGEAE